MTKANITVAIRLRYDYNEQLTCSFFACVELEAGARHTSQSNSTALDDDDDDDNNNNNNNKDDNVYGAVIVAKATARAPGSCDDEYGTAPSGRRPSDQAKRPEL